MDPKEDVRQTVAKTADSPAPIDDANSGAGKGRPTPTRAEREAARIRPLAPNTKEARAEARAKLNEARTRANDGFARGEEKFLPPRDKGQQKRWIRDYVDAGFHLGEWVMPLMLGVLMVSFLGNDISIIAYAFMMIYIIVMIGQMFILGHTVRKKLRDRFGADRVERGVRWYAAMRSMQMRWLRMPKPQVKRGQYPA